jgi:heme-degrading monooxygenase HmoA
MPPYGHNEVMIARIWRGWAAPEQADDYQRHYETEIIANLRTIDGFRSAQLLRRADGDEVLFTAITWFTSLNAIRDYAGEDYEQAVMEGPAISTLVHWDERVIHHVVEVNVPG